MTMNTNFRYYTIALENTDNRFNLSEWADVTSFSKVSYFSLNLSKNCMNLDISILILHLL